MIAAPVRSSVLLRDAGSADFTAIAAIYAHHVRTGFGTFDELPPSCDRMLEDLAKVTDLRLPYLVAVDGETVLGYAYAAPFRQRSAYRFTVEDSIYVADGNHRRGIGTLLLDGIVARCAAAEMRQMVAVIGDSGNQASIGLHEKGGFRRVGIMTDVGLKAGRWLDAIIMQRALGTAAA